MQGAEERKVLQLYGTLGREWRACEVKPFKARVTRALRDGRPERAAEFCTQGGFEGRRGPRLFGMAPENLIGDAGRSTEGNPETEMRLGRDEVLCLTGCNPVHRVSNNWAYFGVTHADEQYRILWLWGGALVPAGTEVRGAARRVVQHRIREPRPPVRPRRGRQREVKAT